MLRSRILRTSISQRTLQFGALGLLLLGASCGDDTPQGPVSGGSAGGNGSATGGTPIGVTGNSTTFNPVIPVVPVSSGEGGSSFVAAEACVDDKANTQPTPPIVEFVVDTSLSMDQSAQGGNQQPSKWEQTRDVLIGAIGEMADDTPVGLVFYPDVAVNAMPCFDNDQDVNIGALGMQDSEQRDKLAAAFADQDPNGSTPTHDAYVYSLTQLRELSSDLNSAAERFVVLITDGEPTFSLGCEGTGLPGNGVETGPLIEEAGKAFDDKIRTFVIGSPGSENARESLSRMAEAGGTASPGCSHDGPDYCHFDMTQVNDFAQALGNALRAISGQTLSCSYDVPAPPNGSALDPNKVNVAFTRDDNQETEELIRSTANDCATGWDYSEDGSQVILCEATCNRIKETAGQLTLAFGCETRAATPQ